MIPESGEEFDYIVVGAGSAGCVVGARLSESGKYRVALLEAGGEDDSFWIHTPLGYGKLYDDPRYNWLHEGEPESELLNHGSFQPRGKVLGGTGSINGMIYVRGHRDDFNRWRQLGNVGWAYDDVLPFFKLSEDYSGGDDEYHGVGGPLKITDAPRHELSDAFVKAGVEAGYGENPDFNGRQPDGFGYNQLTIGNGRRCSSAVAFLRPARSRGNLKVILHATATRILFQDGKARGVEFRQGNVLKAVTARREVILAGGSFNSPQLLQLSGVGSGSLLQSRNVPVIANLPGVGENLQDHFTVSLSYRCTKPITVNDAVNNPLRRYAMGVRYLLFRDGMMASNATASGGCIKTDPAFASPNVKLNLQLWNRAASGRSRERMGLHPSSSFGASAVLLRPESRGTVRIKSNNSDEAPEIRFNLFKSPTDQQVALASLRIMRKVMSMPAMAPYVAEEMAPGPQRISDDDLLQYCREKGRSSHHAASTCKMGVDDMAVVDPRLRVHGVGGLRVIDASIMPCIVSGNTNAASIMIGEKGAAMVLADAAAA